MTRRRPGERIGNTRGTARIAAIVLFAGLQAMNAKAQQDLTGRAILSDQNYTSGDLATSAFDQLYELRFRRQVTEPLSYLLFFRAEQSTGHSTIASDSTSLRFLQLEPHAEASYVLPKLQLLGRYDLIDTRSRVDGNPEDKRRLESLFGSFGFQPDDLPGVNVQFQKTALHSDTSRIDQTQTYLQAGLDYRLGSLMAAAFLRRSDFEDSANGLSRKTNGVQGNLIYQDTLFQGRLAVYASVLASADREVDVTRSLLVSAETIVPIVQALSSIDATPEDARDDPPIPTPGLIDGNLAISTVVSVGPESASFQNIVVDLGRFTALDMFHIHVRDAEGNLVPRGGSVDFTVWTSTDAIRWTPVFGAVRTVFVAALSRYDVTFPATTSRYFKAVSFDRAPTEAGVTEIQAVVHKTFGQNVTRTTDIVLATENATLTWHPVTALSLFYYGLFNQSRETPAIAPAISTTDSDQVFAGNWDVSRHVKLLVQYQWRDVTSTGSFSQTYRSLTTDLRYEALRNVNVTLEGVSASQDDSGVRSDTRTAALRAYLRFLPSLDLSANVGVQRQRFLDDGRVARQWFVTGYSSADLTSDLHFRAEAAYTRNENEGDAANPFPASDERYTGDLYYHPGPQLSVGIQIGWAASGASSGVIQNYRVDWRPFPYGSLNLGARYEENVEPFTNRRSQRATFDPRWRLNDHMTIDLTYTKQKATGAPRTTIFFAAFTATL